MFETTNLNNDDLQKIKFNKSKQRKETMREYHNKYYHNNTNNKLIEKSFYQPKQSEMTNIIAKKILLEQKCDLPDLKEAFITHKPMLDSFIKHVNLIKKTKINYCKIT